MSWMAAAAVVGGAISADSSRKAAHAGSDAAEEAQAGLVAAGGKARKRLKSGHNLAQKDLFGGSSGAFDVMNQSFGGQQQALSQGNLNAQNTISSGLPQIQNALMGTPTNYSAFDPRGVTLNESFANPFLTRGFK
jgi:hypothetical protein